MTSAQADYIEKQLDSLTDRMGAIEKRLWVLGLLVVGLSNGFDVISAMTQY